MTAKRFIVKNMMFDGDSIVDTIDSGYYTTDKQDLENLCKLLNELHEENQSKEKVLHLAANKIETLLEENEKLKKENKSLIKGIKDSAKQGADAITAVWTSQNQFKRMNEGYYD